MKNPSRINNEIIKIINHKNHNYNSNGCNIFSEKWDNLIILDSCRFDIFSEYNEFDGQLEQRISRGSTSSEFIRGNFQGQDRYDTVYCSNNPWYQKIYEELGEKRSDVFRFENPKSEPVRKLGHVRERDEKLTDCALEFQNRYPNKRMIVHYMSPHDPYVDEDGKIILQRGVHAESDENKQLSTLFNIIEINTNRKDHVSIDELRQAYESSVKYILMHINRLLQDLQGCTVITADHGELLGERTKPLPFFGFGHPEGVYMDELIKVPWFVHDFDERKNIIKPSGPHDSMEGSKKVSEDVDERLRKLGYRV